MSSPNNPPQHLTPQQRARAIAAAEELPPLLEGQRRRLRNQALFATLAAFVAERPGYATPALAALLAPAFGVDPDDRRSYSDFSRKVREFLSQIELGHKAPGYTHRGEEQRAIIQNLEAEPGLSTEEVLKRIAAVGTRSTYARVRELQHRLNQAAARDLADPPTGLLRKVGEVLRVEGERYNPTLDDLALRLGVLAGAEIVSEPGREAFARQIGDALLDPPSPDVDNDL